MKNRREFIQTAAAGSTGLWAASQIPNSNSTTTENIAASALPGAKSFFGLVMEPSAPCLPALQTATGSARSAVKNIISNDRYRTRSYDFYPSVYDPESMVTNSIRTVRSLSLLNDSGLPRVHNYGDFATRLVDSELSGNSFPNFGFRQFWPSRIIWGGAFNRVRHDYFLQTGYLARLSREDPPWRYANTSRWFSAMQRPLSGYMTEFFGGRFQDRNGKVKKFVWNLDFSSLIDLDQLRVSPELAGALSSVFVEFLCDVLFRVPYHAPDVLETYSEYRSYLPPADPSQTTPLQETKAKIGLIKSAIASGSLSDDDFETLGLPKDTDVGSSISWQFMPGSGGQTSNILENPLSRMLVQRLQELDVDLRRQIPKLANLTAAVDAIENGQSGVQQKFTCNRAGVIRHELKCMFIAGEGTCGKDDDTGSTADNKVDYAPLIGKIIETFSTAAEKTVKSALGGAIRGISFASLDNEVLAEIISAAGSTLAKKIAEKTIYETFVRFLASTQATADEKREILGRWEKIHKTLKPEIME